MPVAPLAVVIPQPVVFPDSASTTTNPFCSTKAALPAPPSNTVPDINPVVGLIVNVGGSPVAL